MSIKVFWTTHATERLRDRFPLVSHKDQDFLESSFLDEIVSGRTRSANHPGRFVVHARNPDGDLVPAVLTESDDGLVVVTILTLEQDAILRKELDASAMTHSPFAGLKMQLTQKPADPPPVVSAREVPMSDSRPVLPSTQPELGRAILAWRQERGMSADGFNIRAKRPYSSYMSILQIEDGRNIPSQDRAEAIASAMGCQMPEEWPARRGGRTKGVANKKPYPRKARLAEMQPVRESVPVRAPVTPAPTPSALHDDYDHVVVRIAALLRKRTDGRLVSLLLLDELEKPHPDGHVIARLLSGNYTLSVT